MVNPIRNENEKRLINPLNKKLPPYQTDLSNPFGRKINTVTTAI